MTWYWPMSLLCLKLVHVSCWSLAVSAALCIIAGYCLGRAHACGLRRGKLPPPVARFERPTALPSRRQAGG